MRFAVQHRRPFNRQAMTLIAAVGLLALASRRRIHQVAAMPVPSFVSLPEASEYSGLSLVLIERLISMGRLSAVKDGGVVKVRRADIDNLDRLSELTKSSKSLAEVAGELRRVVRRRRG